MASGSRDPRHDTERAISDIAKRDYLSIQLVPVKDHIEGSALRGQGRCLFDGPGGLIRLAFAMRDRFRVPICEQPFS
jgi:hypothetical protein